MFCCMIFIKLRIYFSIKASIHVAIAVCILVYMTLINFELNIDINSIELGKNKSESTRYCELGFESKEGNINSLRAKMEQKIKVIHLIRTDDAYR